mmetsp:Transcript_38536/g.66582  ORF Transcript_38536/g.66582 Transcript_38536/m.66582 type:complete len:223 (-) Transcript_38536:539-1207(-)
MDLVGHQCRRTLDGRGGGGNRAEESVVSSGEHHAHTVSGGEVAARAAHVLGFVEQLVVGIGTQLDVHVLSGKRGVVDLEVGTGQHAHVGGYLLATSDLHDISGHEGVGSDVLQIAVAVHEDSVGTQGLQSRHHLVRLSFLIELEGGGKQHHHDQHNGQRQGLHVLSLGQTVHDPAQGGTEPHHHLKSTNEDHEKLHRPVRHRRRGDLVKAVLLQAGFGFGGT